MSKISLAGLTFAFLLLMSTGVLAQGNINEPFWMYGDVLVNGAPAEDGLLVEAKLADGTSLGATTTLNGIYGSENNIFKIVDNAGVYGNGETAYFFVSGAPAGETIILEENRGKRIEFDLSATIDTGGNPPGGGPPGGSPGGGPSGTSTTTPTDNTTEPEEQPSVCEEKWTCSGWVGDCEFNPYGKLRRVCVDENKCGTEEEKPIEVKDCPPVEESETTAAGEGEGFDFTGAFLSSPAGLFGVAVIVVVILAVLVYWKARPGKEEKAEEKGKT